MFAWFDWLPDWAKKWAFKLILKKIREFIDDIFTKRAVTELEKREKLQKENDGHPPDPDTVDTWLDNGRA